jgi:hypothetical protein
VEAQVSDPQPEKNLSKSQIETSATPPAEGSVKPGSGRFKSWTKARCRCPVPTNEFKENDSMAIKTMTRNLLLTLTPAVAAALALSGPVDADDGSGAADASAIAAHVVPDSTCLFDAGSLGHPKPMAACRAHAIINAGH